MLRGSWAMMFRGRKEDAAMVLKGAKALKDVEQFEQFCKPLRKEWRGFQGRTKGLETMELRVEGRWECAILGLTKTLEALHQFAPDMEAACRVILEDPFESYCYADYIAPGEAVSSFTELRSVEGGAWTVEEGGREVLGMWEAW